MYPAFQPNPEFAVGLNSDSPFLDNPAAEGATTVEEQPAQPATTGVVVPLGVRHNRHFIEANTKPVDIAHLRADCVVPVFNKDNEVTISHQSFIETVLGAAHRMFPQEVIDAPDIVVSHIIKGRIPEAIHKPVNQLLETDKTIYYERMAFCFEIPTIYEDVAGNRLNLSIGGVRAYNHENLYSKKTVEKFKVFIGFKNLVCCNLCVSTDGFKSELRVMSVQDLFDACHLTPVSRIRCRTPCKADGCNAGTTPYRTPVRSAYRQDTVVSIPAHSRAKGIACYGVYGLPYQRGCKGVLHGRELLTRGQSRD